MINRLKRILPLQALSHSGLLLVGQVTNTAFGMVASVILASTLGTLDYGIVLTVVSILAVISAIFSSRFGDVIVTFYTEFSLANDSVRMAALAKFSYLVEGGVRLLALVLTFAGAEILSHWFVRSHDATWLLRGYASNLLITAGTETSLGVLQTKRKFELLSVLQSLQGVVFVLSLATFAIGGATIEKALLAYMISNAFYASCLNVAAWRALERELGATWFSTAIGKLKGTGGRLTAFVINRNIAGTIGLITKTSDPLWLAFFRPSDEVALYKVATSLMQLAMMPCTMMASSFYPHITSEVKRGNWIVLRRLLGSGTLVASVWLISVGVGFAVLGEFLIAYFFGAHYLPSLEAFWPLFFGAGFTNALFWISPLLLALGRPGVITASGIVLALLKIVLSLCFISRFGFQGAAWILAGLYVLGTLIMGTYTFLRKEK